MQWYTRAARLGNAMAAFFLGRLYEVRLGKTAEALRWYETAARGGYPEARKALDGLRQRLALGPLAHARRFEDENGASPYP